MMLHYGFLIVLLILNLVCIGPWSLLFLVGYMASFFVPYLSRFTLPALPIFAWLITFYAVQFIPVEIRPHHIFVNLLPTLEHILYGTNLSEMISQHTHPLLDMMAWIPYGILHFICPFIVAIVLFIYGPPRTVPVFAISFGYMNLAGVLTQLIMPTCPPWYEINHGSSPANYAMQGEPGGLARIDAMLGLELYGTTFGNSPLVFGAFPSLHSGCATMEILFIGWLFPKTRIYGCLYALWMWFATMYLTHHYLIDLVGGSIYALVFYFLFQHTLPSLQPENQHRLDYTPVSVKPSLSHFLRSIEMEKWLETIQTHQLNT